MLTSILDWFATSTDGIPYHPLMMCLINDWFVAIPTIILCGIIMAGYFRINTYWLEAFNSIDDPIAKKAFKRLSDIFVLSAFTGYGFTIIKLFWPAWKLQLILLVILAWVTWSFIFSANGLFRINAYFQERTDRLRRGERALSELEALAKARAQSTHIHSHTVQPNLHAKDSKHGHK